MTLPVILKFFLNTTFCNLDLSTWKGYYAVVFITEVVQRVRPALSNESG